MSNQLLKWWIGGIISASEGLMKWPQLFIEVLSLDSWGRFRTEGYGYVTLPSNPGEKIMHNSEISTGINIILLDTM